MPMQPEGFLHLAHQLKDGDEAARRTAVSRAYYAIYLASGDICKDEIDTNGADSHKAVSDWYDSRGRVVAKGRQAAGRIGRSLKRLKKFRRIADYDLANEISCEHVDAVLAEVTDTFSELQRFIEVRCEKAG